MHVFGGTLRIWRIVYLCRNAAHVGRHRGCYATVLSENRVQGDGCKEAGVSPKHDRKGDNPAMYLAVAESLCLFVYVCVCACGGPDVCEAVHGLAADSGLSCPYVSGVFNSL